MYCCVFNHSFAQTIIILTKVTLFKSFSKIFKDFCGKLKDFSSIFHNFSIFKDFQGHDAFPRTFQGQYEPCSRRRTPWYNRHPHLVPAFNYFPYLTFYKTDISLKQAVSPSYPKGVCLKADLDRLYDFCL